MLVRTQRLVGLLWIASLLAGCVFDSSILDRVPFCTSDEECVAPEVCASNGVCGLEERDLASSVDVGPVEDASTIATCGETTVTCRADTEDCCEIVPGTLGCVNTQFVTEHCGGCGLACGPDQICASGECICSAGFDDCDPDDGFACETSLLTDSDNCGLCGVSCGMGQACVDGQCRCGAELCNPGEACCNGACLDLLSNPASCGACDNACGIGEVCDIGDCRCGPSTAEVGAVCGAGERCCDGACEAENHPRCNCGSAPCAADELCCSTPDETCVSIVDDPLHCGACGDPCPAGRICSEGSCTCPAGAPNICSSGCTNLLTDSANCGACESDCAFHPNVESVQSCTDGTCKYTCEFGWFDCDPTQPGCETPTGDGNCDGCGDVCSDRRTCEAGQCVCDESQGFRRCGNSGCKDIMNDDSHCGDCWDWCNGQRHCVNGVCI